MAEQPATGVVMRGTVFRGKGKGVLVGGLFACCIATQADAGETSVYLKSGWFTWEERVAGAPFVREKGGMYGAGIARKDEVAVVAIGELLEVWGGSVAYDGHDVTGTSTLKSDTVYIGTKEELAFSLPLPAGAIELEPLVAIGHRFWARTRSNEDWNTLYTKAGAAAGWHRGDWRLFVKGGALIPFYTRTHADLTNAGYTDVVTNPKSRVSAFAEGGVRVGSFGVSVEYEAMAFGESDKVPTHRTTAVANGVQVVGGEAYQPESSATLLSLKLSNSF
jgi:hypothetical protein